MIKYQSIRKYFEDASYNLAGFSKLFFTIPFTLYMLVIMIISTNYLNYFKSLITNTLISRDLLKTLTYSAPYHLIRRPLKLISHNLYMSVKFLGNYDALSFRDILMLSRDHLYLTKKTLGYLLYNNMTMTNIREKI